MAVSVIMPNTITVDAKTVPYMRTYALGTGNATVTNAIIVVHGTNRNADGYYGYIEDAVSLAGKTAVTQIIAPQFLMLEDLTAFSLSTTTYHYWSNDGWKSGNETLNGTTSSYAVVDYILGRLCDITLYPSLTEITVTGHSAGGQFTNRYAAGTPIPNTARAGVSFRFCVANPSSYMYFSTERPVGRSTTDFYIPTQDSSYFNQYKYGLEDLNNYMGNVGVTQIKDNYKFRDIDLLLGDDDIYRDSDLDTSTPGEYQGYVRYERGLAYNNHCIRQFGGTQSRDVYVVPGVGHSGGSMYRSTVGRNALYDFTDVVEPPPPPPPPGDAYSIVGVALG